MTTTHDSTRRLVMTALATLPLAGMATTHSGEVRRMGSRTLVAYFSRSGNTRVIAGLIHRQLETDLFEIHPTTSYPEDYLATVDQARQERDSNYEPTLESTISDISNYDTVFLGFPIWGETAPAVIRSFLSKHDLSGKTLIPFVTHGGYGLGNSQAVIASHASNAHLLKWLVMEADQERRTMETVMEWLKGVNIEA